MQEIIIINCVSAKCECVWHKQGYNKYILAIKTIAVMCLPKPCKLKQLLVNPDILSPSQPRSTHFDVETTGDATVE